MMEEVSPTLLSLMALISPGLYNTLSAAMAGNTITSDVSKRPTLLQIYLGILVREKKLIEHLYQHKVTSTYHEVRRFRYSAAASNNNNLTTMNSKDGIIQVVSDNFDADICSQNGLQQTHGLATCIVQTPSTNDTQEKFRMNIRILGGISFLTTSTRAFVQGSLSILLRKSRIESPTKDSV